MSKLTRMIDAPLTDYNKCWIAWKSNLIVSAQRVKSGSYNGAWLVKTKDKMFLWMPGVFENATEHDVANELIAWVRKHVMYT